jgi:hypothetical protein
MDEITQIVGEIVSKIDRTIYGTINPSSGVNEFCATK